MRKRSRRKRPLLTEAEKKERQRAAQARWRKRNPDYNKDWRKKHAGYAQQAKQRWRSDPANVKREEAWALARKNS